MHTEELSQPQPLPSPPSLDQLFLSGGGELGRLMRARDWASTPLGPPSTWPQTLKTAVRIMLTSRQAMFVWWGDALINLYNDAYRAILGGKHPEALGQPASKVWSEIWDQVGPRAEIALRHSEGTYDEALLLIMERNGYSEETYYTFSYSPVPREDGTPGGILCANTDDTRRVIGERQVCLLREISEQTAEARSLEEACALAMECIERNGHDVPFALLYLIDPKEGVAHKIASAGFRAGAAAAPERMVLQGEPVWPLADVFQGGGPRVILDVSCRGDLPAGPWSRAPSRAVALQVTPWGQANRAAVLIVGLNPFRPFDDQYSGFVSLLGSQISASISNAEAYADEKRRAEALAELDRVKTAFFWNISHEFRTPLTLLLGPIEDAAAWPVRALEGDDLAMVHRNALRLLKLVNTLLDFSRLEAGRILAIYRPVELGSVTADLASAFRSAIERAGVELQVACDPLPVPIYVDRDMWEKIVLNLISNALKFTFEGTIFVGLELLDGRARLTVRDTGTGIPSDEQPHLFERFHRVQGARARTHEGTGIGLALVHELVELHGGSVRVVSTVGVGTTFTVEIPSGTAHLPPDRVACGGEAGTTLGAAPYVEEALRWLPDARTSGVASAKTSRGLLPPARILVVDDNADMRAYLQRLLSGNWAVELAADGREALEAAARDPPDLILSDIMMPNLDGLGLLDALRGDERTEAIPIVLLSARAGEEARIEGLNAGADDYLVKPFSARELVARVQAQLALAQLRRRVGGERKNLKRLLQSAPVSINFLRGPDLVIEVAHPLTVKSLGGRHIEGMPLLEAIPELEGQKPLALLRKVYETGEPVYGVESEVLLDPSRSGRPIVTYWNYTYVPVRDAKGRIEGVMTCDVDVTREVLARRELDAVREQAAMASEAKDALLSTLVHELRNPLAPILTALDLLALRAVSGVEKERAIIERQVQRLVKLADDLLDAPATREPAASRPRRPVSLRVAPDGAVTRVRALIVDDNLDTAEMLALALERIGVEARVAHDGFEALALALEFSPEVALVDIGMPLMDGYEVGLRLRAEGPRGLRLFAVTGYGKESDRRRSLEVGFDGHLVKPVSLDELKRVMLEPPDALIAQGPL